MGLKLKCTTKTKFRQDCAIILAFHKDGKTDRHIAKAIKYHLMSVQRILREVDANGGKTVVAMGKGHPFSKATMENMRRVKELARKQPVRHIQQVANACDCSLTTGRCLVKAAGLKSLATIVRPLLSNTAKDQKVKCCQKLQEWFKANNNCQGAKKTILYSDKKLFVVDQVVNWHNRHVLALAANINLHVAMKTKHPATIMVFSLVASYGKFMPPFFMDRGVKINTKFHLEEILPAVETWCAAEYGANWRKKVVLMQDGAPCNTARVIQAHLANNWGKDAFWAKEMGLPSSPDLNPLDF